MSPKQKAEELISKYTFLKIPESDAKHYNPVQCSIICVEEIIHSLSHIGGINGIHLKYAIKHWEWVKQELLNKQ